MSSKSLLSCSNAIARVSVWQARSVSQAYRQASNSNSHPSTTEKTENLTKSPSHDAESKPAQKKTQSQLDDELRQKMAGLSGDGGESGVEYEDGQPVSMKRSVKNNMFRYI